MKNCQVKKIERYKVKQTQEWQKILSQISIMAEDKRKES